jgi:hypothetical protein
MAALPDAVLEAHLRLAYKCVADADSMTDDDLATAIAAAGQMSAISEMNLDALHAVRAARKKAAGSGGSAAGSGGSDAGNGGSAASDTDDVPADLSAPAGPEDQAGIAGLSDQARRERKRARDRAYRERKRVEKAAAVGDPADQARRERKRATDAAYRERKRAKKLQEDGKRKIVLTD